jgi:hypothetical protein
MDCLKFPIKFTAGSINTLQQGSIEYYRQVLTLSILTENGEHPITPDFGIFDPSFTSMEPIDFVINSARFIPEVEILNFNPAQTTDGSFNIEFDFIVRN